MKKRWMFVLFFIALLILGVSAFSFNSNIFDNLLNKKGELRVTSEHPFLINGTWVTAKDLKVGDELFTVNGKKARITKIIDVKTKEPFPVYNLEVRGYENFVLDDEIVVHNSNGPNSWTSVESTSKDRKYYERVINNFDNNIRSSDVDLLKEGRRYSGQIYEPIIEENRRSIDSLARELDGVDLVIGTDRGGSTLADLLTERYKEINGLELSAGSVPKKIETGNPSQRYKTLTRSEQNSMLSDSINEFLTTNPNTKSIAITESVVSGGSANELLNQVIIDMAKENPKVRFKLLLHQQTLGQTETSLRGAVKRNNLPSNIDVTIQESRYLIPEDVNLESTRPITIFRKSETGDIETRLIEGSTPLKTKLINLLTKNP